MKEDGRLTAHDRRRFSEHEVERKKRGDGQWETEVGRTKINLVKSRM
jgi:hypothetical protein